MEVKTNNTVTITLENEEIKLFRSYLGRLCKDGIMQLYSCEPTEGDKVHNLVLELYDLLDT